MLELHKKQKKELNSQIQSLKKTVTKGDRKKKKEIDAQIENLEKDFEDKCKLELSQIKNDIDIVVTEAATDSNPATAQKLSKAQKKRDKKDKENEQREKAIALQEIENLKGPAHLELTKIKNKLALIDLEIKEVISDGHCMYYALSDQLSQRLNMAKTVKELRELTSKYMLQNSGEFQPYMCSEQTGDPLSEQEYEEYCEKIVSTEMWGSMTELKALSEVLRVNIEVMQAEGAEILLGNFNTDQTKLVITYHRHMFGAGEHYNSTRALIKQMPF